MNTNVILALAGAESTETAIREAFTAGYEKNGDNYSGNILVWENVSPTDFYTGKKVLEYAKRHGYSAVTYNAAGLANYLYATAEFYDQEVQMIVPAGSNVYGSTPYGANKLNHMIICGAGLIQNQTGKEIEFFDVDPYAIIRNIEDIRQEGEVYNISQINRISSTLLGIKLSGITDLTDIGIDGRDGGHGIPIVLNGISGTDISVLPPNSTYYTNNGINDTIYLTHTTTSGTIGSWQNVSAGTLQFGTSSTKTFVRVNFFGIWFAGYGVVINGVTGFSTSPDGLYGITAYLNNDGYGDKFEITKTIGPGAYTGGGTARTDTSSYSTPYIAGQFLNIKKHCNCSNWEARQRMRQTASNNGTWESINGYGKPDLAAAIAYDGVIPADPYKTLGSIGSISGFKYNDYAYITFDIVENALTYYIYRDDELIYTVQESISYPNTPENKYRLALKRKLISEGALNKFKYKAVRSEQYTEYSNEIEFKYPMYPKLYIK